MHAPRLRHARGEERRLTIEQAELADDGAGADGGQDLLVGPGEGVANDLDVAGGDQDHGIVAFARAEDVVSDGHIARLGGGGEALPLGVGEGG